MFKSIAIVAPFVAALLVACVGADPQEDVGTDESSLVALKRACVVAKRTVPSGTIVFSADTARTTLRSRCNDSVWEPLDFKAEGGFTEWDCGSGGCTCWGDSDCKALSDSGKCHGNPISCDPVNPSSCHCD